MYFRSGGKLISGSKTAGILLFFLLLPAFAPEVSALSAFWNIQDRATGRERVVLRLEGVDEPREIVRNGMLSVEMVWPSLGAVLPGGLYVEPPAEAEIFDGIEPGPAGLLLKVKKAEFGFVASWPSRGVLQIDLFKSRLGARWKPEQRLPVPAAALQPGAASGRVPADKAQGGEAASLPEGAARARTPDASRLPAVQPGQTLQPTDRTAEPIRTPDIAGPAAAVPPAATPPAAPPVSAPGVSAPGGSAPEGSGPVRPEKALPGGAGAQMNARDQAAGGAAGTSFPSMPDSLLNPAVQGATPSRPAGSAGPAGFYGDNPPALSPGTPGNGIEPQDGDAEGDGQLPQWEPLDMPSKLPAAPEPPLFRQGVGSVPGGASGLNFADLWPFGAKTAHAAASLGGADIIDAPFIYRSGLVKEGAKPSPSEARIPVYIAVPPGTGFDPSSREQPEQAPPASPPPLPQLSPASPQPGRTPTQQAAPAVPPAAPQLSPPASPQPERTQPAAPAAPQSSPPASPQPAQTQTRPGADAGVPSGPSSNITQRITPPPGSTAPAAQPEVSAGRGGQAAEPRAETGQTVVYVDETGKPVDPPLDPQTASEELENMMLENNFQGAYELSEKLLKQSNLSRAQRENILHRRADSFFSLHRSELGKFFKEITDTTTEAVNFNTGSQRNAGAWLRLGYLNLKADNAYEAEAYFTLLRQQFPRDENIPLSYYYMGDYQYEQGNLNDAVLQFRFVVEEFPDSRYSRDAALGLTRTLYRLGYYDKAYEIIDYVEKRWPRFYLDYPPVLSLIGDTAYRARQVDRARQAYWLYYNLQPNAADADIILSRLGDIYQSQKYRNAARHVYEEAAKRFPAKDGGIIAMMRMVENGINDDPSLAGMFKVFKQPYNLAPAETYRKIIRDFPDNPLAMLAKLKLAMWSLWQKDYDACFSLCNEIVMAAPNDPLAARALEVSRNAFSMLAAESVNTKRYVRVLDFWNRYPLLHTQEEFLDPESRLALAVSQWEGANPDAALDTLEPFFLGGKIPEYSEMALILGLTIQVEYDRWAAVEELLNRVEMWEITPETRRQMDYALGLAYENQGKSPSALPIWKNLYEQNSLPPEQQAYADYFLARQAEKDKDYETAYRIGQEALRRLKDLAALNPGQADTEKIKNILGSLMGIAQSSGMIQDALDYGGEYLQYSDQGSDDALSIMYNMAALHRRRGSMGEWEKILTELSANYPQTYYGKAAATQLSSYNMDREAAKYAPAGNL